MAFLRSAETAPTFGDPVCRLGEALLHRNRREEAVECCRNGLPKVRDNPELLRICAWVFSNCECHDEAADVYLSLLVCCPDWIEGHRHASGSLAAAGRGDEAIEAGKKASDLAPDNPEFALHAGRLLLNAGRREEARDYLSRAVALEPDNGAALCALAGLYQALDQRDAAAALGLRAAAVSSRDPAAAVEVAELLMRCDREDAAAALLRNAACRASEPRLLRALSAAEMLCGNLAAALATVDDAIAAEPENAEYYIHRGHLLWSLGDVSGAAGSFERAATLDPASRDLKRAQMDLFLANGLVTEATAAGGDLLRSFPEDSASAEAVLHVLTRRLDTIDGDYVVLSENIDRAPRAVRPQPVFVEKLTAQRRVIRALVIRETRTRFADSRLGYGWAVIEPVLHIALLSATFSVLMHGQPPIGNHFFVFYYTGLVPYHVFVHASSGMSHAIIGNAPLLQLPPVTSFDVIAARGLLEVMTDLVVAVVLLAGFGAIGISALPDDLWAPAMALLVTGAFGCGIGFVNAVMTVFCRSWDKVFAQITRVLYFISGIFYVPGMMPDWARDALGWNPLLHAIDWFRAGFFENYQPHWLDRSYLVILAIIALLLGLGLERGLRRRLSEPL